LATLRYLFVFSFLSALGYLGVLTFIVGL
jgi:hypothetical protein